MAQGGQFWGDMEAVFGKGNVTSGYRSQAEQDALVRAGKTKATRSSHTVAHGYDLKADAASSPEEIRARAAERGLTVGKVRYETGKGRNQGTGPHWHVELAMGTPANSSRPGQGVANPAAFLDGLESQLAPESRASQNVTTSAPTTFGSDAELQLRAGNVEQALDSQGDLLDTLQSVTDAAQATQVASMAEMVEDTRAISDEIVKGTDELRRKVQPVFEARGRIADQMDKLVTMNPLERGLRGIFDLNYDRKFLERQLKDYDTTLQMRANDYDYLNKLHEAAMGEIERRYSLDNAIPGLAVKQIEEDLGIVGMRIQQTAGMLGNLRDRVAGETQLITAKAAAREDMLTRIDGPTVMTLANEAKKAGGIVKHNGIEFSYNELRDRLERDEEQELGREMYRMSIASNRMDIAEKTATNLARSLTRSQAEAAIAAGGVWQGIQLPQDVLQNVFQNHIQTAKTQAETLQTTLPSSMALRMGADELRRISGINQRTRGMFGGVGIEGVNAIVQGSTTIIRELVQATERGDPPEVITALTQRLAQNSALVDQKLDQALLRQSGGNKESAGYLKSFVMGAPMDSAASIQAITHFAVRGARPDGIAMSPEAKQVFQQAERITKRIRDANPKVGADTLRQQVAMELGDYAAKAVGQARYERVSRDIPRIAKISGHPLGKLPQDAWSRARANATGQAYAAVASALGIPVDDVRRMRTTGKPLDSTPEAKTLYDAFNKQIANFNSVEQQALIQEIDDLPQVSPGTRNSSMLIQFLQSPELAKQASTYGSNLGAHSFGDYVVNPLTQGSTESMLSNDGAGLQTAQSDLTQKTRQTSRTIAAGYANDPIARTRVILGSIPGIGKDGAEKLLPVIRQIVKENPDAFKSDASPIPTTASMMHEAFTENGRLQRQEGVILSRLQQIKMQDPALETWRKLAVRGWQDAATQSNSFMENVIAAINLGN